MSSACICGKEKLRYLYTIYNEVNGNRLWPIGSSCIQKFNREDMDEETSVTEDMFRLLHALRDGKFICLSSEFFSRKLLRKLYDDEAFIPNRYNHFNGYNDYQFMLDMFNKRDKSSISSPQQRKIRAIIVGSIRPYLEKQLASKIRV